MLYTTENGPHMNTYSLKDYPPHQKPQSFNLDRIVDQLSHPAQSD